MLDKNIIFVDVETTGINPTEDRIIELGIIFYDKEGKREAKNYLLNPGTVVTNSDIHGITNDLLKDAPTFAEIANELVTYFNGANIFCAYNFRFDFSFLQAEFNRVGIDLNTEKYVFIDPFEIYKKYVPHTLAGAYKYYTGQVLENAHRALDDIKATEEILRKQQSMYSDLFGGNILDIQKETIGSTILISKWFGYVDDNIVFKQGKFKDEVISKKHNNYLQWILGLPDITLDDKKYIKSKLGDV